MKHKPARLAPFLVAITVMTAVCFVRYANPELLDRLERIAYDKRVATGQRFQKPAATNRGGVFISDNSIEVLNDGWWGYRYGVYWPRHIYGRVLRELTAQGARAVAFDVLFGESRMDDPVPVAGERGRQAAAFVKSIHPDEDPPSFVDQGEEVFLVESDDYFAWQLRESGIAILAADQDVLPHPLFATNVVVIGDISADHDADGVLRRARAFQIYRRWHPAFSQLQANRDYGVNLSRAVLTHRKIILPRLGADDIVIPVDDQNRFALSDFVGDELPPGTPPKAAAFVDERVWHMGIVLAARAMELDLKNPETDLQRGKIVLRSNNGFSRTIPVDTNGYFYINWELNAVDPRLELQPFEKLLKDSQQRAAGNPPESDGHWREKLVVIGSSATGNDLTDLGTTPLGKNTLLVSKHWNVANSILTGRFIHRSTLGTEILLVVMLAALATILTLKLPPVQATISVALVGTIFIATAFWAFISHLFWIPIVYPLVGGLALTHVAVVTWRLIFEQTERHRVKSVFSKIVSPEVVNELLGAEKLSLGGARRVVTVLFADVRGFTELTDKAQELAAEHVRANNLTGEAAEAYLNEVAHQTLETVNLYLALVADMVKKHNGTLDKYIGDCVMAFWGAPIANSQHAVACVRAAMDAQRAMFDMNERRARENHSMEIENRDRLSAGLPTKNPLPTLSLGTGINTGQVTVGLMGSDAHIFNYTVFGHAVNLASRLEHESGRGRIIISEATFEHLKRDDPALAARCIPLAPVTVKGIRNPVGIYEVPWRDSKTESAPTPQLS